MSVLKGAKKSSTNVNARKYSMASFLHNAYCAWAWSVTKNLDAITTVTDLRQRYHLTIAFLNSTINIVNILTHTMLRVQTFYLISFWYLHLLLVNP